jgi:hypothetical protein
MLFSIVIVHAENCIEDSSCRYIVGGRSLLINEVVID